MTTSWMWAVDDGVNGLVIEPKRGILKWYDEIGCACDDEDMSIVQTAVSFQKEGVPIGIQTVPDDILAEIRQAIDALL